MPISFLRVGAALAAGVLAMCVARSSNAQTVRSEANNATLGALSYCSGVWAVKYKEDIESEKQSLKSALTRTLDEYRKGREELLKGIKEAEQEIERINSAMETSSMAEAITWEKADQNGVMSKDQIKAMGATMWQNANKIGRDNAEAKLATLRAQLGGVQRRMIGWFAFGAIASQCVEEQEKYIAAQPDRGFPPMSPKRPMPDGTIQSIKATINGHWSANCLYNNRSYPNEGGFSLVLNGNGTVGAAFVDGVAASVKGQIQPNGNITATGVVALQGMTVNIVLSGKVYVRGNKSLGGDGGFTSVESGGIACKGGWNG